MQPAVGQQLFLRKGWFESAHTPALRDTSGEWMLQNVGAVAPSPAVAAGMDNNKSSSFVNPYDSLVNMGVDGTRTTYETERPNYSFPSTAASSGGVNSNMRATGGTYGKAAAPNGYPAPRQVPRPPLREKNSTVTTYKPVVYPPRKITAAPAARPQNHLIAAAASDGEYHVVAPKENLYRISKMYGMTVESLKKLNGLTGETIKIGQKLRVK